MRERQYYQRAMDVMGAIPLYVSLKGQRTRTKFNKKITAGPVQGSLSPSPLPGPFPYL